MNAVFGWRNGTPAWHSSIFWNKEPIIQRFIAKVEDSLEQAEFPLGLELALRVANDAEALR